MVQSIEEQIKALEKQLAEVSGKGSKAKKDKLQAEIAELKEAISDTSDETTKAEDKTPEATTAEEKQPEAKATANVPDDIKKEVSEEDHVVPDTRPAPTKWVTVTDAERDAAEKNCTLCGYNPKNKTALLRA